VESVTPESGRYPGSDLTGIVFRAGAPKVWSIREGQLSLRRALLGEHRERHAGRNMVAPSSRKKKKGREKEETEIEIVLSVYSEATAAQIDTGCGTR